MSASDAVEKGQYLSFRLGGSDYAVGILQMREILQFEAITPVPSMPPSVRGVVNLRGAVLPVLDLAVTFGLPATPVTQRTCILVVETAFDGLRVVVGILADEVSEVLELGARDVEPPPAFGRASRTDFLLGMGKVGGGFVLLLDLDRVLSASDHELLASLVDHPLVADHPEEDAPAAGKASPSWSGVRSLVGQP